MLVLIIIIIISLIIISLFSFPQFSPIPYFPSNRKDLPLIIKALLSSVTESSRFCTIADLGAGDGVVIFEAASKAYKEKLNIKFIAVEINPILILILYIKRFFHPNRKNIKIVWADFFKLNVKRLTLNVGRLTIYLYVSPWYLTKIIRNLTSQNRSFIVVSYMYPIPGWEKSLIRVSTGIKKVFVYYYKATS
jgi:hypothetical protein